MFKLVNKARKNEKGFTLVELMVVVVIIGILVAIAVPIYNNVQASARQKACYANQRTIEGAAAQFAANNNGTFPGTVAEMVGATLFLQANPTCPNSATGTVYTIANGKVTDGPDASCTHGHYSGTPASW